MYNNVYTGTTRGKVSKQASWMRPQVIKSEKKKLLCMFVSLPFAVIGFNYV